MKKTGQTGFQLSVLSLRALYQIQSFSSFFISISASSDDTASAAGWADMTPVYPNRADKIKSTTA